MVCVEGHSVRIEVEKSGKVKGSNFNDSEVYDPEEVDGSEEVEEED